jgi:hypothetical protein
MNLGRSYEAYLSATSRDNRQRLIDYFKNKYGEKYLYALNDKDLGYFKGFMIGLYSLINPDLVEFVTSLSREDLRNHYVKCMNEQISIWYPPDNAYNITDVIANIENSIYKPHLGKVQYTDEFGKRVTTKEDIRVGKLYWFLLEKIATDYSGVSSAKVNNFGFAVKGTNLDKYKYPHSLTPTKTLGETETRIITSFAPPEVVADLYDITLNPVTHKLLIKHILEDTKAFNSDYDINRIISPLGNTKSLGIFNHILNAAGFSYGYVEENKDAN